MLRCLLYNKTFKFCSPKNFSFIIIHQSFYEKP
ncbi:hypothetical protein WN943_003930 [Citrus x changshan-huyou]